MPRKTYGVEWTEVDRVNRIITKRREFPTEQARQRFCEALAEKSFFVDFTAWLEPEYGPGSDEDDTACIIRGSFC